MAHITSITRVTLTILLLLCTTGCTGDLLSAELDTEDPPPPIPMETVYGLRIQTHFIYITGSCDKTFGQPTSGEFQYRYEFTGEGETFELESLDYNSRFGVVHNRVADQQINFEDQTYSWGSLRQTDGIEVRLFGTEWDGAIRDGDMSNRNGARTVPFKLGSSPRTITIGATSECQIYLSYTATWTSLQIPL
ncbi:MAG: hypothetical protein KTR29_01165 [Rhodothermaceae bacterium]|nr:hypothetical protein [Rhodothermaceae bacterium]